MCSPDLMAKRPDEELVEALARRDECALEEIERRYRAQLRSHARRLLSGSGVDPEDLVQETVLRAWSNPPTEPVALAAWLHVVLRNRGVDLLRAPAVRRAASLPADSDRRSQRDAFADADERARLRELVEALREIPPRQRQALVLHVLEGRPQAEIADRLDTTPRSVKTLVHRARRQLADRIEWADMN